MPNNTAAIKYNTVSSRFQKRLYIDIGGAAEVLVDRVVTRTLPCRLFAPAYLRLVTPVSPSFFPPKVESGRRRRAAAGG